MTIEKIIITKGDNTYDEFGVIADRMVAFQIDGGIYFADFGGTKAECVDFVRCAFNACLSLDTDYKGKLKWGEYDVRGRASLEHSLTLCKTHHDDLLRSRTFKNVVRTSDGRLYWEASDLVEVMMKANKAVKNG